jgi:hypothetical protein
LISTGKQKSFILPKEDLFEQNKNNLIMADDVGAVDYLFSFPETRKKLSEMLTYNMMNDGFKTALDRGGRKIQVNEMYSGWRKIQNFAVAMQYIELVRKEPYYFKWESETLNKYEFIKNLEYVQGKISYLSKLILVRKIETYAKANTQYYVGNAKKKNPGVVGPSIYEE